MEYATEKLKVTGGCVSILYDANIDCETTETVEHGLHPSKIEQSAQLAVLHTEPNSQFNFPGDVSIFFSHLVSMSANFHLFG